MKPLRANPATAKARAIAAALCVVGASGTAFEAQATGSHAITIAATVLSKSSCNFNSAASTINLVIDPASVSNVIASAAVIYRCNGSAPVASWGISNDKGQWGSSPAALSMRHATDTAELMPYTLTYPTSGTVPKGVNTTITVTATVTPAGFQNRRAGNYSDSVILTIAP